MAEGGRGGGGEGSVLEAGGAERERNRSVLWVIIGNRKSTRKRLVRGNKTGKREVDAGTRWDGRKEGRKVETRGEDEGYTGP